MLTNNLMYRQRKSDFKNLVQIGHRNLNKTIYYIVLNVFLTIY